jgi:hypothetical protein
MKFKTVAAIVAAATAALSFAAAGSAAAQPLGHSSQHKPAAVPQVTGSRMVKGLLPTSAFGSDFTPSGSPISSGGKLLSTRVRQTPGSLGCGTWVNNLYTTNWGNTAGAGAVYQNPSWAASWPFDQYSVSQLVLQFPSDHAASSFYNEAYAKYVACRTFDVPNPTDTAPGGGSYIVDDSSTHKTTVSGHQAFVNGETWTPSEGTANYYAFYAETLYAVSGTNVYYLWEDSGTPDEPVPALMTHLIQRIQSLY